MLAMPAAEGISLADAAVYWDILYRLIPIALVGGGVAMTINMQRVMSAPTWARRLGMCLYVAAVGCVAAGVAALGLSLFLRAPSQEMQILAGALAGSSGQKIFDIYSRKLFGLRSRTSDDPPAGNGEG
jgi:hypothetical protein